MDVLILRDPRESTRRCSLTALRGTPGIRFVTYARGRRLDAHGRLLLHPDGEELGPADRGRPLLLLDCAWRRVADLRASVDGEPALRRLPELATAYPRRNREGGDPARGLASVEALYAALALCGEPRPELLEGYRWAGEFLAANPVLRDGAGH
jgi:pre-rRNA-processing protein TSR3